MAHITATASKNAMAAALAPTNHPHPLIPGAVKVVRQRADELAADTAREHPEAPLTAAQRGGPDWQTRYGCPGDWCDMDHAGEDGTPGWHQGHTVAVTAPSRLFQDPSAGGESNVLAARINQTTEAADAFGLKTEVWLDVDTETLPMSIGQFRAFVAGMRRILPDLEAMADEAERLSAGDHPGDPEARARYEAEMDAHIKARNEGRFCGCVRCVAAQAEQA